jgi:hypothetical protein
MTGWDVLDKFISGFSPIAAAVLLVTAAVVFIVGFSRRGLNFIKYGFGKVGLDESLGKRFDNMEAKFDSLRDDFKGLNAKVEAIETNHFGHLKNFLTELTSILLDKGVIDNTDKTRLDNQLRGM